MDLMGMSDSDYMYNQTRAHSADIMFLKLKAWFYGITCSVAALLLGNVGGVFGVDIIGWTISAIVGLFTH